MATIWVGEEFSSRRGYKHVKLKPLGERPPVKPAERETSTASGMLLRERAREGGPRTAEVVAAGKFENGKNVGEGDLVLLARYAGPASSWATRNTPSSSPTTSSVPSRNSKMLLLR